MSIPSQQTQTPPMDDIPFDNGIEPSVGGVPFAQGNETYGIPQQEPQQNYGADFDAGVEANEEEDPKKFIQQLTGKLSQSLRKYNESLPKPDAELSKYVAGMILKQSIEGLPQKDVADILDKVDTDAEEDLGQQDMDNNVQAQQPIGNGEMQQPMNETTASTVDAAKSTEKKAPSKIRKNGYARKPFCVTV